MSSDNPFCVDTMLRRVTRDALAHTKGNRTEASRLLGISVRTLRNWINRYDLAKEFPPSRKDSDAQK